jgi:TPR repeat protein
LIIKNYQVLCNGFHYGRNKIITSIARRVAARLPAAIRNKAVNDAKELCATGQYAIAVVRLQCAINFWHLPSIAHMAWLLIDGRGGVARDTIRAYELAEKGFKLGCKHCKGVLAKFYMFGIRVKYDAKRSLELARESSDEGSRYGHCVLANLHELGMGGLQQDYSKAIAFYRLAAEQALDTAQCELGLLLMRGCSECLYDDGLPWLQLAAVQRNPKACFSLGDYYEDDSIVEVSKTEAIK